MYLLWVYQPLPAGQGGTEDCDIHVHTEKKKNDLHVSESLRDLQLRGLVWYCG